MVLAFRLHVSSNIVSSIFSSLYVPCESRLSGVARILSFLRVTEMGRWSLPQEREASTVVSALYRPGSDVDMRVRSMTDAALVGVSESVTKTISFDALHSSRDNALAS